MADDPLPPDDELDPDDEPLPEEENPNDEPPSDDDPDADPPADDEPPADEPPARGKPDASQAAARRTREAKLQERIERLERERTAPRQVDPEAQRRAREEALDKARLDGPEAVAQFYARETEQRIAFANFQTQDRIDQAEFRALCREDRSLAVVKDRVEEIIQTARTNGNFNLTREQAATYALGELARKGALGRSERQRNADAARRRETVPAPRTRSDAAPPRRRRSEADWSAEDYEREIGNQPIR